MRRTSENGVEETPRAVADDHDEAKEDMVLPSPGLDKIFYQFDKKVIHQEMSSENYRKKEKFDSDEDDDDDV